MISPAPSYLGYRFPSDIIAYAIWLYFRFSLSVRDVEDLLDSCHALMNYGVDRYKRPYPISAAEERQRQRADHRRPPSRSLALSRCCCSPQAGGMHRRRPSVDDSQFSFMAPSPRANDDELPLGPPPPLRR